ncbi:MAG: hypothetical protein CMK09_04110 [Ponticaulis sp.]|nr:hypothetical protein [Ponticaulis sp.]|tara:strand:- start:31746 stop:31934 length:189 start_codon:yes stop_codon:yes gene_type:complete
MTARTPTIRRFAANVGKSFANCHQTAAANGRGRAGLPLKYKSTRIQTYSLEKLCRDLSSDEK